MNDIWGRSEPESEKGFAPPPTADAPETGGVVLGEAPVTHTMTVAEIQKAFGVGYAKVKSMIERGAVTAYRETEKARFKLSLDEFQNLPGWAIVEDADMADETDPDGEETETDHAELDFGGVFGVTSKALIEFLLESDDGDPIICHKLKRGGAVLENLRSKQAYLIESGFDKSAPVVRQQEEEKQDDSDRTDKTQE